jgi:ATP-dependent DNA ligase
LRFPRFVRVREDKEAGDINTLKEIRENLSR